MPSNISKAKQIVDGLGGIEKASAYLKKNGNFLQLPGVSRTIDLRVREFLIDLTQTEQNPKDESPLTESDPFSFKIISRYEVLREQCSTRLKYLLKSLEFSERYADSFQDKLNFIQTYLFQPYDFSSMRNSGRKTVEEIVDLTSTLKDFYQQLKCGKTKTKDENDTWVEYPTPSREAKSKPTAINLQTVTEYQILKLKCTRRTIHVLLGFELAEGFNTSEEAKISFIRRFFFSEFNYRSIQNCGIKTASELKNIRQALWQIPVPGSESEPDGYLTQLRKDHLNSLTQTFKSKDLDALRVNGSFSLQRLFCILMTDLKLSSKSMAVLRYYWFVTELLTREKIAEKAGCTPPMALSVIKRITQNIAPEVVQTLRSFSEHLVIEGASNDTPEAFLEVDSIDRFLFHRKEIVPNTRLETFLLAEYLKDEFSLLHNILPLLIKKSRVFDLGRRYYLLKKEIVQKTRFDELLPFLEEEMYALESVRSPYNLRDLIGRFYGEKQIPIDNLSIELLHTIVTKIKRDYIPPNFVKIGELDRRHRITTIRNRIKDFLKRTNQAQKTKEILAELMNQGIETGIYELKNLLNTWKETFAKVGQGAWILTDWISTNGYKGSVREIVEKLLSETDRPLHISEIGAYFRTFRLISDHSLVKNLRVSENIHFRFFNCTFIGLKSKDYSAEWSDIPAFIGAKLRIVNLDKSLSEKEKISALEKFGYPRIHCEYVIRRREVDRDRASPLSNC